MQGAGKNTTTRMGVCVVCVYAGESHYAFQTVVKRPQAWNSLVKEPLNTFARNKHIAMQDKYNVEIKLHCT